jgi:hypothetical protein
MENKLDGAYVLPEPSDANKRMLVAWIGEELFIFRHCELLDTVPAGLAPGTPATAPKS